MNAVRSLSLDSNLSLLGPPEKEEYFDQDPLLVKVEDFYSNYSSDIFIVKYFQTFFII
jgi:hypothetical protein